MSINQSLIYFGLIFNVIGTYMFYHRENNWGWGYAALGWALIILGIHHTPEMNDLVKNFVGM